MRNSVIALGVVLASLAAACDKGATEALSVPVPETQEEGLKPVKVSKTEITSATIEAPKAEPAPASAKPEDDN